MRSFFFQLNAEMKVLNHINNLKSSKSAGTLGIHIKYIKLCAKVISPSCISTGCFPDILKIAEVVPIYKTDPKIHTQTIIQFPFLVP